jgi:hypothetical protein
MAFATSDHHGALDIRAEGAPNRIVASDPGKARAA